MPVRLSIIIATYNASGCVARALDSVINQSFTNWECIVVDGGSTDLTIEIIKGFSNRDSRIRWISEKDNGIYDAFNKGWRMAKGDWVYYLGADDLLFPNALDKVFHQNVECDVFYGDVVFHKESAYKHAKSLPVHKLKGRMISHQCIIMKRNLIVSLGGFDERYRICADFDLFQRAISNNALIQYVPVEIAVFESGGASSMGCKYLSERFIMHHKYGSFMNAVFDILIECAKVAYRRIRL